MGNRTDQLPALDPRADEPLEPPLPAGRTGTRAGRGLLIGTGVWLAAMAAGLLLDGPLAERAYWAAIDKDHPGNILMKMGGDIRFTVAVALALVAWHRDSWRPAALLALAASVQVGVYSILKWVAGRYRPVVDLTPMGFVPFRNGWGGLFDEPNLSFPSGHTCLAFTTAAVLGIAIPRPGWRFVFYGLAAVVAAERVAENAHFVTDVIAGAGVGTLSAYVTFWICDYFFGRERAPRAIRARDEVAGAQARGATVAAD